MCAYAVKLNASTEKLIKFPLTTMLSRWRKTNVYLKLKYENLTAPGSNKHNTDINVAEWEWAL